MSMQSDSPPRPLPIVDDDNREFWESCARHEMVLQRCDECRAWRYYPVPVCSSCGSFAFRWERVSGAATVYTYSVVERAPSPAFQPELPYVYAVVELAEGPMMPTNIVNVAPSDVSIGMPVQLTYRDLGDGVTLPVFEPGSLPA
jgi:uncharacterized OB-fold protein